MKRFIQTSVVTLTLLLAVATSYAQSTTPGKERNSSRPGGLLLSVGPDAGLPIGNLKDGFDWSLGGSLQADYPIIGRDLYVSLNAGYNNFFAKDELVGAQDLKLIPVKAGLKYFPYKNLYVQGLAGVSFVANKEDVGATKSAAFVYAPQIGYLIPLAKGNYLDAGVKFESTAKLTDGGSTGNFFGLHVAYGLNL